MKQYGRCLLLSLAVFTGWCAGSAVHAADDPALAALKGAQEALKQGQEARAWELYNSQAKQFRQQWANLDSDFIVWVADQHRRQKQFKEATTIADGVLGSRKMTPESQAQIMLVKGDTLRDQQNFAAAKLEYESIDRNAALRKTPAGQSARFRIVDVLRQTRDFDGAEQMIERLKDIADGTAQAEAYFLAAKVCFDREDYSGARENLVEVKKRVPDHVETVFLEADLNLREDRLQDPELEIGDRVLTTYVIPGRPVTMKMQDRNLAVVRGGGGIPVEVVTRKGKDRELMNLLPSPRDPTLFRGTLNTKLGDAVTNDMRLQVMGDDVVVYQILPTFQKENNLQYEAKTMAIIADGDLTATAGEFQSTEERDEALMMQRMSIILERDGKNMAAIERIRDPWLVRPGNPVRIQVTDYDRDISSLPDTVSVRVQASSGDVVASVPLTETEPHSGIFRGVLKTSKSPPRATASDSADKSDPNSAILVSGTAGWKSAPRGESNKWFEVDLMTIHPLATCELDCTGAGTVKDVSLYGQNGEKPELIGSTKPSRERVYGYVDLARHFGESQKNTAAYLYTELTSEIDQEVTLKIGSCDGVVAWVNGKQVHSKPNGRIWKPEEDVIQVPLKAGRNGIVLKVLQINGPWGASMTVVKADGTPLTSMKSVPPAAPGVVTQWHLFNRPTPEEGIQFAELVSVDKPVRIKEKTFRWVPMDVTPVASLVIENGLVKASFHKRAAYRKLRWSFDAFEGNEVAVKKATVRNAFNAVIVPSAMDFSQAAVNDTLELGPGDQIEVAYVDERRIRRDDNRLTASLKSGFFNAQVKFAYETIEMNDSERRIHYDPAFRFRSGATESVVCHITDYDADVSDEMDKVKILVTSVSGEKIEMDALETGPHSGDFLAILRLGAESGKDTIKVAKGDTLTLTYSDDENSDGRIAREVTIQDAPTDPPELLLYQTVVLTDDEGLMDKKAPTVVSRPMPGEGMAPDKPLLTTIDTSLVFRVLYPAAALSENSVHTARLTTERAAAEAQASGGQPAFTDAVMGLTDPINGEFSVSVDVRVGDPSSYADLDRSEEALGKRLGGVPRFYIKNGDVVRVTIPTIGEGAGTNGWFKLASDASLKFTDRRYLDKESQVFAGDFTYIKLADRDMDKGDELDTVTVNLITKAGTTPVTLTEVLPHAGVFSGRVKTDFSGSAVGEGVLPVQYGETITAEYSDALCVGGAMPRKVAATVQIYMGDDAKLATFTKRFSDEDIAVKTRLLMAEALFELAKEHRDAGQKDLAAAEIAEGKQVLEEAIADYPSTVHAPHAEFLLGNLAQELEKYEEALERYNKVLSNWPDSEFSAKAQLRKGICLEKMGDMDNALDAYVELTYSYPRSPLVSDSIIRLAQYFYKTKEFEVAGKIFGNFQQRNPDHELAAKALFLSAQSYMKGAEERKTILEGRYDTKATGWLADSIEKFEKLIATYDDKDLRAESMYWLGDCYIKNQDMKNAYITLKRLTWDYPETKWAKFARGQLVQNEQTFKKFATEQ